MTDNVNHPAHYETGKFECIEVMLETQGVEAVLNFCQCNAFKYLYRAKRKNGLEDMKKAVWYLNKYIELKEGHNYAITHDVATGGSGYKTALPPEVAVVIKKAYFLLENLWENYMQSGKVNPVAGIFLGKNNYGYQDKTEYVLTPNQQNDNDYSADEIRERYIASDQQKRLSASNSDEDTSD